MRISFCWLKENLGPSFQNNPEETASILRQMGFEVSNITHYPKSVGVVTAKILEICSHPFADRLRLVKVTDGQETSTVVCGAPNVTEGKIAFWAKVGANLANGMEIKQTPIRGIVSPGMLCSLKELGVGEDSSGIWLMDERGPLGVDFMNIIGGEEFVLDLEITPNRPDALSQIGIARELAAAIRLNVLPNFEVDEPNTLPRYPIEIEEGCGCNRYIARKLENITIAPSPLKIKTNLERWGLRTINNVVDITNYVMMETGQPLHAFDADKLAGKKIVVRRAKEGENMLALDGKNYALDPSILVIADERKPVAIAGIMGGDETAVKLDTKNILLESAVFDPQLVRKARIKLGLSSESSYRFERGVSRWSVTAGSAKASNLIQKFALGNLTHYHDCEKNFLKAAPTIISYKYVENVLGEEISPAEAAGCLERLGVLIENSDNENIVVEAPNWRLDLLAPIDFIEEIARVRGYHRLPARGTLIRLPENKKDNNRQSLKTKIRALFSSAGYYEACNYGFVSKQQGEKILPLENLVELANPFSEEQSILRPSLTFELLKNLQQNLAYRKEGVRLFEIGKVFMRAQQKLIEKTMLAGAACGPIHPNHWQTKNSRSVDLYWLKGVIEALFKKFNILQVNLIGLEPQTPVASYFLHPTKNISLNILQLGSLGWIGAIHPKTAQEYNLNSETDRKSVV